MIRHCHHHRHDEPTSDLYLIVAPDEVISLADMKKHLRVDAEDDNELIEAYTTAITQHLDGRDGYLRRSIGEQTWELRLSWFPGGGSVPLPLPPLIEVVSVAYTDAAGSEQTFDGANYSVTGLGTNNGRVVLGYGKTWPAIGTGPEPVKIRFRAGYIDGGVSPSAPNVPGPILSAIKLMVGALYENRESVVVGVTAIELPWAVQALLGPYRVYD
ncbi:head-tail connector protein [Bradyrhizobium prioriisuperbiae]|uniref:head-tail connector protein n=1 Tax=Bradyrhizobium prioriisuperbiae TaxID=2854389 RepID=UPI0028EA2649|nr:phage head-tail connector protein [Bradyrhizobium prioritasuperba]